MQKKLIALIVSFFGLFVITANSATVLADDTVAPPSFPSCNPKIFQEVGDWAHYYSGTHQILGDGLLTGSDDVYSLADGNFLQCYCSDETYDGIQTNWWNVGLVGLTQEQIDYFTSNGWIYVSNGTSWNLFPNSYLGRNLNFICNQETPTPTPSLTITVTPTITPTPGPKSVCWDLVAEPMEGTAPLTVRFTAHADDPATGGKLKEYKFDFGDASDGQPQVWSQDTNVAYHKYQLSGEYTAKVDVQDYAGNWRGSDDCRITIKVNDKPEVLGVSIPDKLPETGASVLGVLLLIPAGIYLRKRFRLI